MKKLYVPSGIESTNMIKPRLSLILCPLKIIKIFIVQRREAASHVYYHVWLSGMLV